MSSVISELLAKSLLLGTTAHVATICCIGMVARLLVVSSQLVSQHVALAPTLLISGSTQGMRPTDSPRGVKGIKDKYSLKFALMWYHSDIHIRCLMSNHCCHRHFSLQKTNSSHLPGGYLSLPNSSISSAILVYRSVYTWICLLKMLGKSEPKHILPNGGGAFNGEFHPMVRSPSVNKSPQRYPRVFDRFQATWQGVILLMKEILHHPGCMKPL